MVLVVVVVVIVEARGLRACSTALSEVPTAKLYAAGEAVGGNTEGLLTTAEVLREAETPL